MNYLPSTTPLALWDTNQMARLQMVDPTVVSDTLP